MPAATPPQAPPGTGPEEVARRWFPLIPRAKPRCEPLPGRLARVRDLARVGGQTTAESLSRAAEAHNLAALILSDCGLPAQAHDLCRRQAHLFASAGPLDLPTAKLALQPAINIGRLLTREGNADAAYQHFQGIFRAAQSQTDTEVSGMPLRLRTLVRDAAENRELTQWLWAILLADGTRALTSAGRWSQAVSQAQQHNGIGQRLLDGRQTLILAHCHNHDYVAALTALTSAVTPTTWEQAVAACLKGLLHRWRGGSAPDGFTDAINRYFSATPSGQPVLFRVRLCLTITDILGPAQIAKQAKFAALAARLALDSHDAYAAYDVVTSPACVARVTPQTFEALRGLVRQAHLRAETLSADLTEDLMTSVRDCEAVISSKLSRAQ